MIVYSDLDNTLIDSEVDAEGQVVRIIPRPGVQHFLSKLGRDADPWLLTAASRRHAERALDILEPGSRVFKGIISMEDMLPIEEQIDVIDMEPGLNPVERLELWEEIKPLYPPGPIFDNMTVGSWAYFLKAAAVGVGIKEWIEVEHFGDGIPDSGGLKKAYEQFRYRYPNLLYMSGVKKRA